MGSNALVNQIFTLQSPQLELLAKVVAAERFQNYLRERLLDPLLPPIPTKTKIQWTAKEFPFVELMYAFDTFKVFNDGTISLKVVAETLAAQWGIKFTQNLSSTWSEIKDREKGVDWFIQQLAKKLVERAKSQDNKSKTKNISKKIKRAKKAI